MEKQPEQSPHIELNKGAKATGEQPVSKIISKTGEEIDIYENDDCPFHHRPYGTGDCDCRKVSL